MTTMEVRRRFAGRQVRCPYCQVTLEVPQESQTRKKDDYAIREGADDLVVEEERPAEPLIAVTCSACATRMYATRKQAGEPLICPDCGKVATVPRPVKKAVPLDEPPPAAREEYKIYGEGQPPPSVMEVHQRLIPVVCSLCHTRLLATVDQLGQKLTCPDCFTENEVREPKEVPKLDLPTAEERGEYALHDPVESPPVQSPPVQSPPVQSPPVQSPPVQSPPVQSPPVQSPPVQSPPVEVPDPQELFLVKCPTCLTRLYARAEQSGQSMKCPDCRKSFTIPKPPPKAHKPRPEEEEPIEEYGVGVAVERTAAQLRDGRRGARDDRSEDDEEGDEEGDGENEQDGKGSSRRRRRVLPQSERPVLPPLPLVNGVLVYPFQAGAVKHWLILSATACVLGLAGVFVFMLARLPGVAAVLALPLSGLLVLALLIWLIWVSLGLLAVTCETASGSDTVEGWSSDVFDRMFDALYIFNSFALSSAVGLAIDRFATQALLQFQEDAVCQGPGVAIGVWLLFPILLLSFLETGSFINPASGPVWRSLVSAGRGWLGFYLLSAMLWSVAIGLDWALVTSGGYIGVIASACLFCATLMIYFRMLGRLGWYCTERVGRPEPTQGQEQAERSDRPESPQGSDRPARVPRTRRPR
jgi:DNA-directed RNA polymerase subunit M/transcription elongation factor TFIIS